MAVLFWSFLIWAISFFVSVIYMMEKAKEPNMTRLMVTSIPIVNTLFAITVVIFTLRVIRIEIKSIIKEFKDIKNDKL